MLNNVRIQPIYDEIIPELARLHMIAFEGYTNTKLGSRYVEEMFKFYAVEANRIALYSSIGEDKICGYVIGAPVGYGADLVQALWKTVAVSVAARPRIWLDARLRSILWSRLCNFARIGTNTNSQPDDQATFDEKVLTIQTISLVGIAVHPDFRGQHIGELLMIDFEERAKNLGYRSMRLTVYPENDAARRLYHRAGWLPQSYTTTNDRAVTYYKNLVDI